MNFLKKRLPTVVALVLLMILVGGLWWWMKYSRPKVSEDIKPQKVRITNVADNKFSVSWTTKIPTEAYLEYGEVGQKLALMATDDRGGKTGAHRVHHITIKNLQPNTRYAFRLLSGDKKTRFDNNGVPYDVTTGGVIGNMPTAKSLYGKVELTNSSAGGSMPEEALVYLAIPNAEPASVLTTSNGNYSISLATIRSKDRTEYLKYSGDMIANISVEDGLTSSSAKISLGSMPIPTIAMGEVYNFAQTQQQTPSVAEVKLNDEPQTPTIFNVEPLGDTVAGEAEISLLNPSSEGEKLATTMPEFRGLAPAGEQLAITLHAGVVYTGMVTASADKTWSWTPPEELLDGEHSISITYTNNDGVEKNLTRNFIISTTLANGGEPAFEATPSGGVYASPLASQAPIASESGRVAMPSTESGVPVTGVMTNTLLTGVIGLVIIVLGGFMLAI